LWDKKSLKCTVNPAVGEEKRFEVKKAYSVKRVVIIGAGPAGMEAALIAEQRGHEVILYEEKDQVGGKLLLGAIPPFKPEIGKLLEYYQNSIDKSAVEVRLGQKIVSTKEINEESPEVIIVAVGAELAVPRMPGIKGDKVISVLQLYKQEIDDIGKEVVIIGAGLVGCETSWYLALQGKSVTLIDILSREELLPDEHPTNRLTLLRNMEKEGVTLLDRTNAKKIVQEGVIAQMADGCEELLKADKIILATGFKPITELKDAFIKDLPDAQIFWIGDCKEPGRLYNAIHEGCNTVWQI
jgi:pyruvate/2-oxoglutarate dehydrogenase complex dihydrolipoamide dehydrogenase (E3) component